MWLSLLQGSNTRVRYAPDPKHEPSQNTSLRGPSSTEQAFAKALQRKIGQIDGQTLVKQGLT